jgi:predicted nucleotidyltransferase component of viral defense system
MSDGTTKNKEASIIAKLKNEAKKRRIDVQTVIDRYVLESFLRRLAVSEYADQFCLKGGLLFSAMNGGDLLRPTKDIDLNGFLEQEIDPEYLTRVVREVAAIDVGDGVTFDIDGIDVKKDRSEGIVAGGKVSLVGHLFTAKSSIGVDFGFGNAITPAAKLVEIPSLLPDAAARPRVYGYPLETTIAEKFHAMVQHGRFNTRHKDYYDLWKLSQTQDIDCDLLAKAFSRTFARQHRDIPAIDDIDGISIQFARDCAQPWKAFTGKNKLEAPDYETVMDHVRSLVLPVVAYLKGEAPAPGTWQAGQGWDRLDNDGPQFRR